MPRQSARAAARRPSGEERVFSDAQGRLWSAVQVDGAVVFTCITEGRISNRALAVSLATLRGEEADETLRAWLDAAPRIGTLT